MPALTAGLPKALHYYSIAPPATARAALARPAARLSPERQLTFSLWPSMILPSPALRLMIYYRTLCFL